MLGRNISFISLNRLHGWGRLHKASVFAVDKTNQGRK
jgi:hypothetical protein